MSSRKNSRTARQLISATRHKEEALRALQAAEKSEKIAATQVELLDILEPYLDILSIDEIRDVILELEESVNNQNENNGEFNSSTNNPLATDTSEDEYIEVSDDEGGINMDICDEVTFSLDGKEANIELIQRLNSDENLLVTPKRDNSEYFIKNDKKKLIIINNNDKPKNDYGLIITCKETSESDIVQGWEKYGAKQSKKRKFNFKGENVEEVIQMIHLILVD